MRRRSEGNSLSNPSLPTTPHLPHTHIKAGWGKRLSYVIAVDENGVVDVSCRYARDWEAMKARRVLVDAGGPGRVAARGPGRQLGWEAA